MRGIPTMRDNLLTPKYTVTLYSDRGEKLASTSVEALDKGIVFPPFTGEPVKIVAARTKFIKIKGTDSQISASFLIKVE